MAERRIKGKLVPVMLGLLAIGIGSLLLSSLTEARRGRLKLPVGRGVPAISLGERHGLILAADGSLWTWGSDFLGWPVLGLGKSIQRSTTLRHIGQDTNWVSISAGVSHSLAIKADGTIWTWGESVHPQLAIGTAFSAPTPAAPGHDWKQAAAGGIHTIAVKRDGTLWGWGNNWAGSVGIGPTNGSFGPVQIGSGTHWTKVWAGMLESVAMQSDGSLWYWGENPNPDLAQGTNQVWEPRRVSPDTNWVDVGFGNSTVFAIKTDGTLWTWGHEAHVYTGARNNAQAAMPTRVGTDSDWRSFSSCTGWWCQGLTKKDGSFWLMDASEGNPNGPRPPYQPVRFRRMAFQNLGAVYAGGAVHAAAPGYHGPIAVWLTPEGDVWTWGMVLGDPLTLKIRCEQLVTRVAALLYFKATPVVPDPVFRNKPWRLRNTDR